MTENLPQTGGKTKIPLKLKAPANPEVLIKITHSYYETLLDHRIISFTDCLKLSDLLTNQPDFIVGLSGPNDWEVEVKYLRLESITDSTILNAFRLVYPKGIHTVPVYDDIWKQVTANEEELQEKAQDPDYEDTE
jgi:hypothetical protein